MEGDHEHQIEAELTLLHTLIDKLLRKEITPDEAEYFYQGYIHDQDAANEEIRWLEETFGL